MKIVSNEQQLKEISSQLAQGTVVTIGNFDGVHLGHQELLLRTVKKAQTLGIKSLVITFEPRPVEVFAASASMPRLFSRQDQAEQMQKWGIDFLYVLKFDQAFASRTYEEFIDQTLRADLKIQHLVLGHDFALGKGRAGTAAVVQSYLQKQQIEVQIVDAVLYEGQAVSTTRIKKCLGSGQVEPVTAMLKRNYYLAGKVIHGLQRGRTIGVPTANMELTETCLLQQGVYATEVEVGGLVFKAVTNVGTNPTVPGADLSIKVESHIFEFSQDIYGQPIKVLFKKFIRPEVRFENFELLKKQIVLDIQTAKELLK